uniref:Uncharacterized protein n=1 Tax=Arundo donax TaxID=35708 RepID=A0A0A9HFS8_ARUDO
MLYLLHHRVNSFLLSKIQILAKYSQEQTSYVNSATRYLLATISPVAPLLQH